MSESTSLYPAVEADAAGRCVVSHAGTVLLLRTAESAGVNAALTRELARWRKPHAVHDPGKVVLDLAVSIAAGGDCLADLDQLRTHPQLMGQVASDPTVSRLIGALADDVDAALAAIAAASAQARSRAWELAGQDGPDHEISAENPLTVDLDGSLVTAHSEKEHAAPNFKRGFGFHPLLAFVDHGQDGTGEPAAVLLRPGYAGSNTAADHITVVKQALAQLPDEVTGSGRYRVGRTVLIRCDGGGGTHAFLEYLTRRRLAYTVGFALTDKLAAAVDLIPDAGWIPAIDNDSGELRKGAWIAELTHMVDLTSWPAGMRLIVRAERPHPGAQLTFTDRDGLRLTAFVTNSRGKIERLELRHRRRARCEDRIRALKDTGLRNLPGLRPYLQLAERAPTIPMGPWRKNRIAVVDQETVVKCLIRAATSPDPLARVVEVPSSAEPSHRELVEAVLRSLHRSCPVLPLPWSGATFDALLTTAFTDDSFHFSRHLASIISTTT